MGLKGRMIEETVKGNACASHTVAQEAGGKLNGELC